MFWVFVDSFEILPKHIGINGHHELVTIGRWQEHIWVHHVALGIFEP